MQLVLEGDQVTFTPHYVFSECKGCDKTYVAENCYGAGRYCATEPVEPGHNMNGRDIIDEDLR